jgi:hypothetical protein
MKDEGGRMKEEAFERIDVTLSQCIPGAMPLPLDCFSSFIPHSSSLILHPSSFILHPSSF